MASKFIFAALFVVAVAHQVSASCYLPPRPVPCNLPGAILPIGSGYNAATGYSGVSYGASSYPVAASSYHGISLTAPSAPSLSFAHGPSLSLPSATVSFPSAPAPYYPAPTSVVCPKAPAPKVHNQPDVAIPLALPSNIPLGQYCSCQKYSIKPTIVPCH